MAQQQQYTMPVAPTRNYIDPFTGAFIYVAGASIVAYILWSLVRKK